METQWRLNGDSMKNQPKLSRDVVEFRAIYAANFKHSIKEVWLLNEADTDDQELV